MPEENVQYEDEYGARGHSPSALPYQQVPLTVEDFMRKKKTGIIGFLIRKKLAKNERQAKHILLACFCGFAILAAGIFYWGGFGGSRIVAYNLSPGIIAKLPSQIQEEINSAKK